MGEFCAIIALHWLIELWILGAQLRQESTLFSFFDAPFLGEIPHQVSKPMMDLVKSAAVRCLTQSCIMELRDIHEFIPISVIIINVCHLIL
jgi:hypothetical protein